MRTYSIEEKGRKFATVCREDGFWAITFLSKNTRRARQKGEEFISGERTAMRKYVTRYGEALNTAKSNRRIMLSIGHYPNGRQAETLALIAQAMCNTKESN